jgi:hypothetical protein
MVYIIIISDYWADAWRQDIVEELRLIDVTNFAERYFKTVKYEFFEEVVNRRLSDLFTMILFKCDPYYIQRRRLLIAGRTTSKEVTKSIKREREIHSIFENPSAVIVEDRLIGLVTVASTRSVGSKYRLCVGELDCECGDCREHTDYCKHLEGEARHPNPDFCIEFTQAMRLVSDCNGNGIMVTTD